MIETGANQAFIFASNKQRVNVGASEMVRRVGTTWVEDALAGLTGVRPVVCASGKALLLADSADQGRTVVSRITRRALTEAPGLDVWGVVDETPAEEPGVGQSLARVHRLHAAWRSRRPSPLQRNSLFPPLQPCALTGAAASAVRQGSGVISQAVEAAWKAGEDGRRRMAEIDADAVPSSMDVELQTNGWIAVVHADGNGIGQLLVDLAENTRPDQFTERLTAFSTALDQVTQWALDDAIAAVRAKRTDSVQKGWLLPLIVGGDDVTLLVDARSAHDLVVAFLERFMAWSAQHEDIMWVAGPGGLTAAAGVAYVKPHHPFSDGYQLAEDLCASAKTVKQLDPDASAFDFHVLHASLGGSLGNVRADLEVRPRGTSTPLRLWSGPHVIPAADPPASTTAEPHNHQHLQDARELLARGGPVSSSLAHDLRSALVLGGPPLDRAEARLRATAPKTHQKLTPHLTFDRGGTRVSRIIDALDLNDVAAGTAARRTGP